MSYHEVNGNSLIAGPETLYRQVHPDQYQNGIVSKQAFMPSERDAGLLSTNRERIGAAEAHRRWIAQGYLSSGTWGISTSDTKAHGLPVVDDEEHVAVDDHASVDFEGVPSKGSRLKIARDIRDRASERGCLYGPFS